MLTTKDTIDEQKTKINISELYSQEELQSLLKVFPELSKYSLPAIKINKNFAQNSSTSSSSFSINKPRILISKDEFAKLVLSKVKSYFEINESFTLVKSLNFLLKEFNKDGEKKFSTEKMKNLQKPKKSCLKSNIINGNSRNFLTNSDVTDLKQSSRIKSNNVIDLFPQSYLSSSSSSNKKLTRIRIQNKKLKKVYFMDSNTSLIKTKKPPKTKRILNKSSKIFNSIKIDITPPKSAKTFSNIQLNSRISTSSSLREKKILVNNNKNLLFHSKYFNMNNEIFSKIETEDFDIFSLDKNVGQKNTLPLIGFYIFNRFHFHDLIDYQIFENWCKNITNGYIRKNPYHTDLHAADITQTCLIYFKLGKINELCKISHLSKCALFLSCIAHDFKHPGVNNNFLKETNDDIAIRYNDKSILENMHISETFNLIKKNQSCNIFKKLDKDSYQKIREQMIACVLYTDMVRHNKTIDFMKEIVQYKNYENKQQNFMNLLIHSADISNPTKKSDLYFKWAKLVVEEFYLQGDKEKKLGMKCSCDRNTVSIYQSQLGFINYIEIPFYELYGKVFPKLNFLYENLLKNKNMLIEAQKAEEQKNK